MSLVLFSIFSIVSIYCITYMVMDSVRYLGFVIIATSPHAAPKGTIKGVAWWPLYPLVVSIPSAIVSLINYIHGVFA